MTYYDICSLHRKDNRFSNIRKIWCNAAKFDCGICATTHCTADETAEIEQAINAIKKECKENDTCIETGSSIFSIDY